MHNFIVYPCQMLNYHGEYQGYITALFSFKERSKILRQKKPFEGMELRLQSTVLSVATFHSKNTAKASGHGNFYAVKGNICSPLALKLNQPVRKTYKIFCAVPETAASIVVAATIVGAAATLLAKRTEASEKTGASTRICDDCGGSGVCSDCKGEGFVLKNLPEESAERARMMAKNMATRYTAGLPKKWSYCSKCSSSRLCRSCDGRGKLSY